MGGGASLEHGLGMERDQYFCHSCHRLFGGSFAEPSEMTCPMCNSAFVEMVQGATQQDLMPVRRGMVSNSQLTPEQMRRFSNATAMLRLLETQLREELEQLQLSFEADHLRINESLRNGRQSDVPKLSKIMAGKLRMCLLDLDVVCSQPSCPICSEDFVVGTEETKLPCGHLYHRTCVMPWLETKQNCPICRTELSDELPALSDLEKLPERELNSWLDLLQEDAGGSNKSGFVSKIGIANVGNRRDSSGAPSQENAHDAASDDKYKENGRGEGKDDDEKLSGPRDLTSQKTSDDHFRYWVNVDCGYLSVSPTFQCTQVQVAVSHFIPLLRYIVFSEYFLYMIDELMRPLLTHFSALLYYCVTGPS
jgi:RNA polymerase subunit RPABC4/transcription elongation factor Spt4